MIFVSTVILSVCIVYLVIYTYNSNKALEHLDTLENIVLKDTSSENTERKNAFNYTKNPDGRLKCYTELHDKNSDMVGWISIADTDLSYPVMQQNNNSYYLNHNFDNDKQSGGLPILDYQCDISKPSTNLIVYGHNMRNGSIFATLLKYKKEEFFNEHKTIVFDSVYEHRTYTIISVFNTKVGSAKEFKYHEFIDTDIPDEFNDYVSTVKELSLYDISETALYGDSLITLSTCSYGTSNERMVVVAKRIK